MLDKYEGLDPIGNLQGIEVCFHTPRKMDDEIPKVGSVPFLHATMPYAKKHANAFFNPFLTTVNTVHILNAINVTTDDIFRIHSKMKQSTTSGNNNADDITKSSSPFLYHNALSIYKTKTYQLISLIEKVLGMLAVWSCGESYQNDFIEHNKQIPITFFDIMNSHDIYTEIFDKTFPDDQDKQFAIVIYETNVALSGLSSTYTVNIVGEDMPTVCAIYLDLQKSSYRYHNHALSQIIFGLDDLVKRHGIIC